MELTRSSSESEEVLKGFSIRYTPQEGYMTHNRDTYLKQVSIKECAFNLLQWLLDRDGQVANQINGKSYIVTFALEGIELRNKDLIQAIDSAVKAIKKQKQ